MACGIYVSPYIYIQSARVLRGAPGDTDCGNLKMYFVTVLVVKSVLHYHRHSVRQGEASSGMQRYRDNRDGGPEYGGT